MGTSFQDFEYEIKDEGICICACFSMGTTAEIPEKIDGLDVVEIASYAFAGNATLKEKNGMKQLAGGRVEEIILPKTLKRIGRYAFYNCKNLRRLEFYNILKDLGAGAFTGCHKVQEIKVTYLEHKQSILREFLVELPEEQLLELFYEDGEAKLVFPEFFEESVENTPARNIEIFTHGSGMMYRNCFVKKELDFLKYDERFAWAKGKEFPETLFHLAVCRLLHPYALSEKYRQKYLEYLKEHLQKCALWAAETEKPEVLYLLADSCAETAEEMDLLISAANRQSEIAVLSYLMDKKHQKFKAKRKSFEL